MKMIVQKKIAEKWKTVIIEYNIYKKLYMGKRFSSSKMINNN